MLRIDVKKGQYRLRMSSTDERMLNELEKDLGLTKAEILRKGIKIQYDLLRFSRENHENLDIQ